MAHQLHQKHAASEKGYPWMFFYASRASLVRILLTLLIIGAGGLFYIWYCQFGNDIAPDSMVGFGYAIAGTVCFMLAATLYTLRRRSHKRTTGQLNAALNWHAFFAVLGLAFVLMHSFGNFNAKTGTYALYGLIALMVNGFTGRVLDRLLPRLMAAEVSRMLTWQGEDRLEVILHNLPPSPSWPPGNGPRVGTAELSEDAWEVMKPPGNGPRVGAGAEWMWGEGPCGRPLPGQRYSSRGTTYLCNPLWPPARRSVVEENETRNESHILMCYDK